jgi:hypothetical protein
VAAGSHHSLALLSNGTVMAWGDNENGQFGNATTANSSAPVAVPGLSGVVAIAATGDHNLALLSNGSLVAWGANGEGELGTGSVVGPEECTPLEQVEACARVPVRVSLPGLGQIKGIGTGWWHSLVLGPPRPAVTALSPHEGPELGATLVTISGTELAGATAVKFGSANATAFVVESATSIRALAPAGAGTVDVTIITPEGTSLASPADRFTYTALPAPARVSASATGVTGKTGAVTAVSQKRAHALPVLRRLERWLRRHRVHSRVRSRR